MVVDRSDRVGRAAALYVAKCPDVDLIDAVYIDDCYNSIGISTNSPKP